MILLPKLCKVNINYANILRFKGIELIFLDDVDLQIIEINCFDKVIFGKSGLIMAFEFLNGSI